MAKPIFLFDADCEFCQYWKNRWQKTVGESVDFQSIQSAADRFPQISKKDLENSSQFIDEKGIVYSGAKGVFEMLACSPKKQWPKWLYDRIAFFRLVSEFVYKKISSCKICATKFMKFFLRKKHL